MTYSAPIQPIRVMPPMIQPIHSYNSSRTYDSTYMALITQQLEESKKWEPVIDGIFIVSIALCAIALAWLIYVFIKEKIYEL